MDQSLDTLDGVLDAVESTRPRATWTRSAALVCGVLAAGAGGLAVAEHRRAHRPLPRPTVSLLGRPTSDVEALVREWEAEPVEVVIGATTLHLRRSELGVYVDRGRLDRWLSQASDPESLLVRTHLGARPGEPLTLGLPLRFEAEEWLTRLTAAKDAIDRSARDARLDPRTGAIRPHQDGRSLDLFASIARAEAQLRAGETHLEATIVTTPASRRAEDLEGVRVEAVLGAFETRYSTLEEAEDRTFNLRVAAAKLDGTVLWPGETLDFNALVGERSEANGFRPAPQIAGGELVDGVGGGTCQIAGTLHAAAFFAGLNIVERSPHSRPSAYLWMGLDAVVVYPQHNLRFTNDFAFPVAIGVTVEGGVVRAELRGRGLPRAVTFTRRVDAITPYTEREVPDPTLPAGVRVLRQRGVPGFRISRFRVRRDTETNQARRTRWEDTYPPTEQVWRVGTGAPPAADYVPPEGDSHGEYTADELLSATFTVGTPDLSVTRRAGRSGAPGWTATEGMPQVATAESP